MPWKNTRDIQFFADGLRVQIPKGRYEATTRADSATESIFATVPLDRLRYLAQAKAVSMKIELDDLAFPDGKNKLIGEFVEKYEAEVAKGTRGAAGSTKAKRKKNGV